MLIPTHLGRLRVRRPMCICTAARSSSKMLALAKARLAIRRLSLSSFLASTSFTFTQLRKFSIVFPKTLLFMSLNRSFSKSLVAFFRSSCVHPYIGLHPGALPEEEDHVNFREDACPTTGKIAGCDSGAHSVPYCGGLGPASQPRSAPPQRLEGRAGSRIFTPSEPPCAPVPVGMHCTRREALVSTPQVNLKDVALWVVSLVVAHSCCEFMEVCLLHPMKAACW